MQVLIREPRLKQDTLTRFMISQISKRKFKKHLAPLTYTRIICSACLKEKRDFNFQGYVVKIEPFTSHAFCEVCGSDRDLYLVTLKEHLKGPASNKLRFNGFKICGQCVHYDPILKRCKVYKNLRFLSPLATLARSCAYFLEVDEK